MIPLTSTVKLVIAGIALAGVLGIGVKIYSAGKEAGRGDGSREQLDIDKKSMEQERKDFQAKLAENQQRDSAAQAQIAQQRELIDRATSRLSQLAASRAQDQRAVAGLSDSSLVADLRKKLNVAPNDPSPNPTPAELREIDAQVTDYAPLRESYQQLSAKQDATDKQIASLNERVNAISAERDSAVEFGNQMVGHYTAAYNAAQKHHSKLVTVLTFGLVRTKKLDLPDPVTLSPAK